MIMEDDMRIPLEKRDLLYSLDFPCNKEMLLYILEVLCEQGIGFYQYNISSYELQVNEHESYWRYIFEFIPEQKSSDIKIQKIIDSLSNEGLYASTSPIFVFGDYPRTQDFCRLLTQIGQHGIIIRSLITQTADEDNMLDCIVVPKSQGDQLQMAIRQSKYLDNPVKLKAVTCEIGKNGGASDVYCSLADTMPRHADLYSTAISWCQDYRIVEIAAAFGKANDIENTLKNTSLNVSNEAVACYGATPRTLETCSFYKIVKDLIVNHSLDIISMYSGAMYGVETRTTITVNDPEKMLRVIDQLR